MDLSDNTKTTTKKKSSASAEKSDKTQAKKSVPKQKNPKPKSVDNVHAGHRKRLRAQIRKYGGRMFYDHQILEAALFFIIRRKDTNETGHHLVNKFGNLEEVLAAPIKEKKKVHGVGPKSALFLSVLGLVAEQARFKPDDGVAMISLDIASQYFKNFFANDKVTGIWIGALNNQLRLTDMRYICDGNFLDLMKDLKTVFIAAHSIRYKRFYIVQNVPEGSCLRTSEELKETERLRRTLLTFNLFLVDHIVVGNDGVCFCVARRYFK